ncbi:glycosyltransferase [Glycomyces xiaoerkulensis]|uniref:glycosyltransferase n=1 Tax=Glycomyces xiaoerkulensis TaxID=2038139 RepID=UPI0018E47869|nr:glycosyltransferase [Glycomyces xiaoerkulensis]
MSVVIPAYGSQEKLDLVLAALAAQTYPAELTETVVVDDNSAPPLRLPELRPERTRLVVADKESWGSAHAVNTGVAHSEGEVILRLDSDMVAWRDHIEAQMRWHHAADYLAVLGHKRFVDWADGDLTPEQVYEKVVSGEGWSLFERERSRPQWIEHVIADTDGLTVHHPGNYRVFIGATGSLHRDLFKTAGGLDAGLRLGSDTEFAYRLAQAGAVFVPETTSSAWHLGIPQMQAKEAEGREQRLPYIAQRVPLHGMRRSAPTRGWLVPHVDVVIDVAAADVADVDAAVAPILAGPDGDVRITLVTGQDRPRHDREAILSGEGAQARLIEEMYDAESRVRIASEAPPADPAVPYRLLLPAPAPLRENAMSKILGTAHREDAGLVLAALPGAPPARLERTAAFARARHIAGGEADLDRIVAGIWGVANHRGLAAREPGNTAFTPPPASLPRRLARRFLSARRRARLRTLFKRPA